MEKSNQKFMQNYYFNIILKSSLLLVLLTLVACKDIFEENISNDEVIIILPQNMDTLLSNQVYFKWEALKGATAYELHIVRPSFNDTKEYLLDSLIENDEFRIILDPGLYAYKLRATNPAYMSDFSEPRTFFIDSVSDLSGQFVQLLFPQQGAFTNKMAIDLFSWQNLFLSDFYTFQIWNGAVFGQNSLLHQENTIFGINYSFFQTTQITLEEGEYSWGVKAINEVSESTYSSYSFAIDTTAPNNANLVFPLTNDIISSNQLTLRWNYGGTDPGIINSPVTANVQISFNDSLFNNTNITEINNISADSLQRQFLQSGYYWWRVYLRDEAGNESYFYSSEEKITIP